MEELFPELSKENTAIRFIQKYEPLEGYYLGFSGGKDSVVLYDLTKRAGVKFFPYCFLSGNDSPELIKFIKQNFPDVQWIYGKKFLPEMKKRMAYPTRVARWCCSLKKEALKSISLSSRLLGIRSEESFRRAQRYQIDPYKKYKQVLYKPIFYWLEWEIWEYIEKYKLPVCELYDDPFIDRIGCVVCPFLCSKARQKTLETHKEKWPLQYKAFENVMLKIFNEKISKEYPNLSFNEFLDKWYKQESIKEKSKEAGMLL